MGNSIGYDFIGRDRLSAVAKRVSRSMRGLNIQVASTNKAMATQTLRMKRYRGELGRVGNALRGVGTMFRGLGPAMGLVGMGMVGGPAAIAAMAVGGMAAAGVSRASSSETARLKILTNAPDMKSAAAMEPLLKRKMDEMRNLGIGTEESGNAIFRQLSQRGFNADELENMDAAVKLSIGAFVDLAAATTSMNKAVAIWPDEMPDRMAEKILAAQQLGDTDVAGIAGALPMIGSTARQLGFSADAMLAHLASGSRILRDAKQASVGIRGIGTQIMSLGESPERFRMAQQMGFITGNRRNFKAVGEEAFIRAAVKANEGSDVDRNSLMRVFAGEESRALMGIMDNDYLETYLKAKTQMQESAALEEAYQRRMLSASMQWKRMSGQFATLVEQFGELLLPVVKDAMKFVQKSMDDKEKYGGGLTGLAAALTVNATDAALSPVFQPSNAAGVSMYNESMAKWGGAPIQLEAEIVVRTENGLDARVASTEIKNAAGTVKGVQQTED